MSLSGKPLPSLMHEPAALVEKPSPVLVHDDSVRINQHNRRRVLGPRIDRLGMHAIPVSPNPGAVLHGHANAVAGVVMRARRQQPDVLTTRAEMPPHPVAVGLKAPRFPDNG